MIYVEYLIVDSYNSKLYKEYDVVKSKEKLAERLEQYWAARNFLFLGITKTEVYNG